MINTKLKMVSNSGEGDKEEVEIRRKHKSFKCLISYARFGEPVYFDSYMWHTHGIIL